LQHIVHNHAHNLIVNRLPPPPLLLSLFLPSRTATSPPPALCFFSNSRTQIQSTCWSRARLQDRSLNFQMVYSGYAICRHPCRTSVPHPRRYNVATLYRRAGNSFTVVWRGRGTIPHRSNNLADRFLLLSKDTLVPALHVYPTSFSENLWPGRYHLRFCKAGQHRMSPNLFLILYGQLFFHVGNVSYSAYSKSIHAHITFLHL